MPTFGSEKKLKESNCQGRTAKVNGKIHKVMIQINEAYVFWIYQMRIK